MTPGLALTLFLASLTTAVSIKYNGRFPAGLRALEIRIGADVRHRGEYLGKAVSLSRTNGRRRWKVSLY